MTDNTSRTDGYLRPTAGRPAPAYDDALDDIFQGHVIGITGLPGPLVRPRWQPRPPKQPEPDVDWCSVGVKLIEPTAGPFIEHEGTSITDPDDGVDVRSWHEEIELLASFYGPHASGYASMFLDGCGIPQNAAQLRKHGISFVSSGPPTPAPDFINQRWVRRVDVSMTFRRKTTRTYNVRNLSSVGVKFMEK